MLIMHKIQFSSCASDQTRWGSYQCYPRLPRCICFGGKGKGTEGKTINSHLIRERLSESDILCLLNTEVVIKNVTLVITLMPSLITATLKNIAPTDITCLNYSFIKGNSKINIPIHCGLWSIKKGQGCHFYIYN